MKSDRRQFSKKCKQTSHKWNSVCIEIKLHCGTCGKKWLQRGTTGKQSIYQDVEVGRLVVSLRMTVASPKGSPNKHSQNDDQVIDITRSCAPSGRLAHVEEVLWYQNVQQCIKVFLLKWMDYVRCDARVSCSLITRLRAAQPCCDTAVLPRRMFLWWGC